MSEEPPVGWTNSRVAATLLDPHILSQKKTILTFSSQHSRVVYVIFKIQMLFLYYKQAIIINRKISDKEISNHISSRNLC